MISTPKFITALFAVAVITVVICYYWMRPPVAQEIRLNTQTSGQVLSWTNTGLHIAKTRSTGHEGSNSAEIITIDNFKVTHRETVPTQRYEVTANGSFLFYTTGSELVRLTLGTATRKRWPIDNNQYVAVGSDRLIWLDLKPHIVDEDALRPVPEKALGDAIALDHIRFISLKNDGTATHWDSRTWQKIAEGKTNLPANATLTPRAYILDDKLYAVGANIYYILSRNLYGGKHIVLGSTPFFGQNVLLPVYSPQHQIVVFKPHYNESGMSGLHGIYCNHQSLKGEAGLAISPSKKFAISDNTGISVSDVCQNYSAEYNILLGQEDNVLFWYPRTKQIRYSGPTAQKNFQWQPLEIVYQESLANHTEALTSGEPPQIRVDRLLNKGYALVPMQNHWLSIAIKVVGIFLIMFAFIAVMYVVVVWLAKRGR